MKSGKKTNEKKLQINTGRMEWGISTRRTTLMNYSTELSIGRLDWSIDTHRTRLISNNCPFGWDTDRTSIYSGRSDWAINLSLLTLSGQVGTSTRASTRTPLSWIESSTRASTNSARLDCDVDTSHHTPTVTNRAL